MLQLSRTIYEMMIAHCRREAPKEACGLLAGSGGAATAIYPMTNADNSPISYTMDPLEQLRAQKAMRAEGVELAAIYHSHTASPAYPSPTDIALATYPDAHYVVVSLAVPMRPVAKAFRIIEERVAEEDLHVIESAPIMHPDGRDAG